MADRPGPVALLGAGVIGGGWAARFLLSGWDVRLHDPDPEAGRKVAAIVSNARRSWRSLTLAPLPDEGSLTIAGSLEEAVAGACFVQESAPEQEPLKQELLARADAVALGPGLGRSDEAVALARRVAAEHAGPVVIDADGLFAFGGRPARLRTRPGPTVLTPHEGEMARLLGVDAGWVRANRLEAVRKAAAASSCVVLLKGSDTLVADPDGRVGVSHAGPPGLATAGSGDVLTGTVAAMLAKGGDPALATCIAAEAHGLAGQRAVERRGPSGIIATDVIDALPEVLP